MNSYYVDVLVIIVGIIGIALIAWFCVKTLTRGYEQKEAKKKPDVQTVMIDCFLLIREIDKQIRFYENSNPGSDPFCQGCDKGALAVLNWFKKNMFRFVYPSMTAQEFYDYKRQNYREK